MIAYIEDEFYKIIQPIIQRQDNSNLYDNFTINIDLISSRDKINLINNLKVFIKANVYNPSLSMIFSKHLSIIFSHILFKSLDDIDQNVRIAADECANQIIRLTSCVYSPYIIYNLFVELKNNASARSINGALHKFSALAYMIKHSKRQSYVNNILPVLKVLLIRPEESVLLCLVETLPKIVEILFPFATSADIETSIIVPLLRALADTSVVGRQRNLAQLVAISCVNLRDRSEYFGRLLRYCASVDFADEDAAHGAVFLTKSLLTIIPNHFDGHTSNDVVLMAVRLLQILERDCTVASKNLALDCLWHMLQLKGCISLFEFMKSVSTDLKISDLLRLIDHDTIFVLDDVEPTLTDADFTDLTDIVAADNDLIIEEEDTLFTRFPQSNSSDSDNVEYEEQCLVSEELTFASVIVPKDEIDTCVTESSTEESLWINLGTFEDWSRTSLEYMIKLMILQFLPDCINDDSSLAHLKKRSIRVNSKVLAINCLSQLSIIASEYLLTKLPILNGTCYLPAAVDCVLFYLNDEDSQLCGAAVSFIGQVISARICCQSSPEIYDQRIISGVDHVELIHKIQLLLHNPISGQHLKFVLSSLKLFLWDLVSTSDGNLVFELVESVVQFANHNYKLVRREVISVCRCVDFRNIVRLEKNTRSYGLVKKMSLSEKCFSTVLSLVGDVEQDVREDACGSIKDLIANGVLDNHHSFQDCSVHSRADSSQPKLSPINQRNLIPFICSDINVTLLDVRRKLEKRSEESGLDDCSAVHRCLHIVIENLLSTPVPSGKEMKTSLNNVSGCVSVLIMLLERYPINTHPRLWIVHPSNKETPSALTTTRNLISYCISLLNTPLVMTDMPLHTDILHLVARLILHGGLEHLLLNNFLIDKTNSSSGIVLYLNTDLALVASLKLFMVHLCRMLNVFWHVFQFLTPVMPVHKTVLPNLSSQSSMSPPKKKPEPEVTSKASSSSDTQSSTDTRPPRSKSSLGFFVNHGHYMSMYKALTVAYNSFLISSDSANYSDRLVVLLAETLDSMSTIMEIISFNEVSPYVEEFLSYCSVFYNILPMATIQFIVKLLGSLFGTNVTAQWDPFLSQVYSLIVVDKVPQGPSNTDVAEHLIEQWRKLSRRCESRQVLLKNASVSIQTGDSMDIEKWDDGLSDTFQWLRASGKRREPGILRQMVSANSSYRPNLSHYIGLFEKHVFQCMRQYLASPPELQTSIIQLLCQLIYLRVNYCQLDSEQKFLNIILNQLESFTSSNIDVENKSFLIIEIIEFLILITYEKAATNKRDQPILSLTQVIHSVESLLLNGISVKSVVIPSLCKIVCDLFVHRSVWLNNPGNFNLLPSANTSKEIEVQREAVLDLILRKLLKCSDTLEVLALIVEHSAREHEVKWEMLSLQVWTKVSAMLLEDEIEFSEPVHVDHLLRLVRVISLKAIMDQPSTHSIANLALKYNDVNAQSGSNLIKYRQLVTQSTRIAVCLHTIVLNNVEFWRLSTQTNVTATDERSAKKEVVSRLFGMLQSLMVLHAAIVDDKETSVDVACLSAGVKLIRMFLFIVIEMKRSGDAPGGTDLATSNYSGIVSLNQISEMDPCVQKFAECETDISLLWNELKLQCGIDQSPVIRSRSPNVLRVLLRNNVLQMSRYVVKVEQTKRESLVRRLISDRYMIIIQESTHANVRKILEMINSDDKLSAHFVDVFKNHSEEISRSTNLMMMWLNAVEGLHVLSSEEIIATLSHYVTLNIRDIRLIVVMKIDAVLCLKLSSVPGKDNQTRFGVIATDLKNMISLSGKSFPKLSNKLRNIEQSIPIRTSVDLNPVDPLSDFDSDNILDEKKFWKQCVEKSLLKHDQDVRLCPRLLQGGTASDFEEMFHVNLSHLSGEVQTEDSALQTTGDYQHLANLPPRFIQQCLRLGFLRSGGGGVTHEGIRVDVIFRLGKKLMFQQLSYIVGLTKDSVTKGCYTIVDSPFLLGLLAAINDYLSLSCQMSVPMPVSSTDENRLVNLIEDVCILILASRRICSRILIEEVLTLMTSCFCPAMKDLRNNLSWSYICVIVDFLYSLVGQFSQQRTHTSKNYPPMTDTDSYQKKLATVVKMDKILGLCLHGLCHGADSALRDKLRSAIITIVRLPPLVKFSRNPNNIKAFDLEAAAVTINDPDHKDVLELDCLSKMNRDELASAQTLFSTLGWISRFMFEETWLIYLNLLHDKGPSAAITGEEGSSSRLSHEEVVEQGHCDSLGLLGVTNMLLKTTARPSPGNPIVAQLEHRPRDKTPNLLHTKIGRKLSTIHGQIDEEIFSSHRGLKMMLAGWTISSWNIEREDSILQYRHDQINVNVLSKRISIGSRSPQFSGSDNNNLDVLSCLQSLPIIYEQWLQLGGTKKSVALWPRASALRSSVILMDLFSSREQVQWLLDCLLDLSKSINIEDDWITLSWLCIGLSKCVSVLETSSNATLPQAVGKPPVLITTISIYGLLPTIKFIETCINSDLTILQQSALHSVMFLLQMTVYGKATWDLPNGSLVELKNLHDLVITYLEEQLLLIDASLSQNSRSSSCLDVSNNGSTLLLANTLTQAMSTGAANFASNVNSQLSSLPGVTAGSYAHSSQFSLPRLLKSHHGVFIRSERHNHLVMAAACFYCETYQEALPEADLLNNFVTLSKNVMQTDLQMCTSATSLLILCRCLERCFLTQRVSTLVIEQIIRICSNYLKTCKSTTHALPVLRLFLTSCYLSLANSLQTNPASGVFESVFYNGPTSSNVENQLVMLERVNVFWKRLTDVEVIDVVESRILSRLISSIMTEFMSGEEILNKTIHQLLRSWPRANYIAKTLFDIITRCLNQTEGEKLIRRWALMVLPSLTSCRPVNLSVWVTTIVLVASASSTRTSLRAIFSQCLDWLTAFEAGVGNVSEMETCLFIAALAFVRDMSRDPASEIDNRNSFFKAIHSNLNIPSFQKLYTLCLKKKLV